MIAICLQLRKQMLQIFSPRRIGHIEDRSAVNLVALQNRLELLAVEDDRLVADGDKSGNPNRVGKYLGGRKLRCFKSGRVVVFDAARFKVLMHQLQKLHRKKIGNMSAKMKRCVHQDQVESSVRMSGEPPAPIVNDDMHFGVS